jgi:hypothetical protein
LTVESIIRPVTMDYTVPVVIGRGYSSLPPRHEIAQRFRKSGKERLVLVVVSDHDPEGDDIPHSLATSMRDDFGIAKVDAVKAGLTQQQVDDLRLAPNTTAKEKSSRRNGFVRKYGEAVFELEAVSPTRLQEFVRSAVEGVLDMDLFRAELERERQDARELAAYRQQVHRALSSADASRSSARGPRKTGVPGRKSASLRNTSRRFEPNPKRRSPNPPSSPRSEAATRLPLRAWTRRP